MVKRIPLLTDWHRVIVMIMSFSRSQSALVLLYFERNAAGEGPEVPTTIFLKELDDTPNVATGIACNIFY